MKVFGCDPSTLEASIFFKKKRYTFYVTMKERDILTSCIEVQLEVHPYTVELNVMKNH